MAPKKSSEANKSKRKSVRMTIELKRELIAKHESSTCVSDLAAMFEMPKSTMCTILKNKEMIKAADVAKGVMTLASKRSKFIEESVGLEVSEEDAEELVEDDKNELITEELQHLHKMQQEEVAEELSSEEEEGASGNISSAEIKELYFLCFGIRTFLNWNSFLERIKVGFRGTTVLTL
ncbi:hypothetical protein chiPu_0005705 [Chiloscyllium punctatum]|uniref:Uncharacterized protein n=1 Tax=Chiloscyllium punctatum TaxID=137246 RepID=A0A401SA50_CHIPU|nr:hypothetical protein [Chiloscyllium punctatum]